MPIQAPTIMPGTAPDVLQQQRTGQMQRRGTPEAVAINARLEQLPSYRKFVELVQRQSGVAERNAAYAAMMQEAKSNGILIPDALIFDPYTAQVREKTWDEEHPVLSGLAYSGAAIGAGLTAGAAAGALAGPAAASTAAGSYGPMAAGYGAATTTAAVPAGIAAGGAAGGGMGATGAILNGVFGGGGGSWGWLNGAVKTGLDIYGGILQRNAAEDALGIQSESSKYSADLQAKSAEEALAFARQAAENDWRNQEIARNANYGQWRAREARISDFGNSAVGLPARQIPDYVPGVDPGFMGSGGGTIASAAGGPPAASGPVPGVNASNGDIKKQVLDYFASRGVAPNPSSGDYWAQKWNEFGARDPEYFNRRLAMADEFGGQAGPAAAVSAPRFYPMGSTIASMATPQYLTPNTTPALQMPGTIAGLVR